MTGRNALDDSFYQWGENLPRWAAMFEEYAKAWTAMAATAANNHPTDPSQVTRMENHAKEWGRLAIAAQDWYRIFRAVAAFMVSRTEGERAPVNRERSADVEAAVRDA